MPTGKKLPKHGCSITRQDVYGIGMIMYVVVLDERGSGEYTPFQGFSLNALEATAPIRKICELPAHIDELFRGRAETARSRMNGQTGYSIVLLETESFKGFPDYPGFVCAISNSATHSIVSTLCARRDDKRWLHVTTAEEPTKELKLWELDRSYIFEWIREAVLDIASRQPREADSKRPEFRPLSLWDNVFSPVGSRGHNVLIPTETVYSSLGYQFDLPEDRLSGNDDETFARAITATAGALGNTLTQLTGDNARPPGFPSIILTVPSIFRHLASNRPKKGTPAVVRRAIRAVMRQRQYTAFRASMEETKEFLSSDLSRSIIELRAQELSLYTAALTVAACSRCCPCLRLPPQLDLVRSLLGGLASLSRKGNAVQRRRNQLAFRIGETYRALLPKPLLETIDGLAHTGVKLIGDVPLELLPIDGLPLSLRCSVSRLPTLTGNLLVRHSLLQSPLYLKHLIFTMFSL